MCLHFPIMTFMDSGRYLHFLVPLLLVGLASEARQRPILCNAAICVTLGWAIVMLPHTLGSYHYRKTYIQSYETVSRWLNQHPVSTPILVHDAGYISEATPFPWLIWWA